MKFWVVKLLKNKELSMHKYQLSMMMSELESCDKTNAKDGKDGKDGKDDGCTNFLCDWA